MVLENTKKEKIIITKHLKTNKIMKQEEIQIWIDKWSKLKPTPQRNMVIKIWSRLIKNK